jgi:catechol 2,3-dioxygenase-like lactoylglutathione lyase family enzyme
MIGYVMVGTNNFPKAVAFYDELLALLGAKRIMEDDGKFVAWGNSPTQAGFAVTLPYNGKPATVGNGTMNAFAVDSKDKVHAFYDKALQLGGTDEGPAGPRSDNFYAGYFRDLDGNKLNVFCMT